MMKKQEVDKSIVIAAIFCLTLLEICAMYFGINGTFRTIIFTAIAALAGIAMPTPKFLTIAERRN